MLLYEQRQRREGYGIIKGKKQKRKLEQVIKGGMGGSN